MTKKHPIFAAPCYDWNRELDGRAAGNVIAADACLPTVLVAILRRGDATALRQNTSGNAALMQEFWELLERRYREG